MVDAGRGAQPAQRLRFGRVANSVASAPHLVRLDARNGAAAPKTFRALIDALSSVAYVALPGQASVLHDITFALRRDKEETCLYEVEL